jgi:hypothetical protein
VDIRRMCEIAHPSSQEGVAESQKNPMWRSFASTITLALAAAAAVFATFFPTVAVILAIVSAGVGLILVRNSEDFAKLAALVSVFISVGVLGFVGMVIILSLAT